MLSDEIFRNNFMKMNVLWCEEEYVRIIADMSK